MNFYKNHFGMIIASVVALCISLILATCVIFIDHLTFSIPLWIRNWGTAFLVISITGMVFPLTDWSFALCRKLKIKPETLPHVLIENTVACLFFNTFAALVLAGVNIFGNPDIEAAVQAGMAPSVTAVYWQSVAHDWPITFAIAFVAAFFITKLAIAIAKNALGLTLVTEESPQKQSL